MHKLIRKLLGKLNIAIILFLAVLVAGGLGSVTYVLAAVNDATQNASTSQATTIEVKAQDYSTAVTSITFPVGAPSAEVSLPTNSAADTQTFGGAGVAKPVVTLLNGSAGTLTVWYNITTFTNGAVSSENYAIKAKAAACADATCITETATFDADTVSTGSVTTIVNGAGNERDLYLKVGLSALAGKSGTSTLTILGET